MKSNGSVRGRSPPQTGQTAKPLPLLADCLGYDRLVKNCFKILDREVYSGPIKLSNFPVAMLLESRDSGLRKVLLLFLCLLVDSSRSSITDMGADLRLPLLVERALLLADKVSHFSKFLEDFQAWDARNARIEALKQGKSESIMGLDEKPILFSINPDEPIQSHAQGLSRRDIRDVLQTQCLNNVPDPRSKIIWMMPIRQQQIGLAKARRLNISLNQSMSRNRKPSPEVSRDLHEISKGDTTKMFKIKRSSTDFKKLTQSGVIQHVKKKYTGSTEQNCSVNKSTVSNGHSPALFSVPKVYTTLRQMKLPQSPGLPPRKASLGTSWMQDNTLSLSRLEASFSQTPTVGPRQSYLSPPSKPILAELDCTQILPRPYRAGVLVAGKKPVSQFLVCSTAATPPRSGSSGEGSPDSFRGLLTETDI